MNGELGQVEAFWDDHLCGSHFIDENYLSPTFFEEYRAYRYRKEHHLDVLIDWSSAAEKDMLEIGLGVGADATKWAAHAKSYTGVDLTQEAVDATTKHFDLLDLSGNIRKGNAESLEFQNDSFDLIYSHGVLHHTPNMPRAFSEVNRVLKDNGEFIVMLYAKESFNYWIRIQCYFRWRLILEIMLMKLGRKAKGNWALHLKNYKEMGWKYLNWKAFPHRCTDGPECEVAFILSRSQVKNLLRTNGFTVQKMAKAHFPFTKGNLPKLERAFARVFGFYRFVWCKKNG